MGEQATGHHSWSDGLEHEVDFGRVILASKAVERYGIIALLENCVMDKVDTVSLKDITTGSARIIGMRIFEEVVENTQELVGIFGEV